MENEEKFLKMFEMMQQQQQAMQQLIQAIAQNRADGEGAAAVEGQQVQVVESRVTKATNLASSMESFEYNPEDNAIFETWYSRYATIFVEIATWPEPEKVRLLLRKFSRVDYNRFSNTLAPRAPEELTLVELIEELKKLFGRTETKFSMRYKSFSVRKEETESYQDYGARINQIGEKFEVRNFTDDDCKTLLFVSGLKCPSDSHILEKLLVKVNSTQRKIEAAATVAEREAIPKLKISDLVNEALSIISLKADKAEVTEQSKTSIEVNAIRDSGKKNTKRSPKPGTDPSSSKKFSRPCKLCGGQHWDCDCTFADKRCSSCSAVGHKAGFCTSALESYQAELKRLRKKCETTVSTNQITENQLVSRRKFISPIVNGVRVKLQLDSGSDITIISHGVWKKLGKPTVYDSDVSSSSASGDHVQLRGVFTAMVKLNDKELAAKVYVSSRLDLLGNDWMTDFGLWDKPLSAVCHNIEVSSQHKVLAVEAERMFSSLFSEGLGLCTKTKASLTLLTGTKPIFRKARSAPFAAMPEIEAEIERQRHLGVYTPSQYSDFAAPIVAVKKKNGKVRICGDYSTGLNAVLEPNKFPLPTPEQIFTGLTGKKYFSKIDLSDAFLQVELDDDSKKLLTINTHVGLFTINRLQPGVKSAPGIFQEIMSKMLSGANGAFAFIDDIVLGGATQEEHRKLLHEVLSRIENYGFKLRIDKCQFGQTSIPFCGHVIDSEGISPDPSKIQSIMDIPRPSDLSQLRSFLGAVNYYGKFIKSMTDLRGPLDELTKKEVPFDWQAKHELAFNKLKEVLNSDLVLTHFDPNRKIVVAADASCYGKSGTLMHESSDGKLRPIFHVSSSLNAAEKNYPQIQREAAALVFAVTRFHKYIYGRKFELQTDHQPLLAIFGSKSGIPAVTSSRLQRYALTLLAYEFNIKYIDTKHFGYADMMSRLIASHSKPDEDIVIAAIQTDEEVQCFAMDTARALPIKFDDILRAQQDCPIHRTIAGYIENGWPDSKKHIEKEEIAQFFTQRDEFNLLQGCVFKGERIMIPSKHRPRVLEELHAGHPGIVRMKLLARSKVFWYHMDKDIERSVKSCEDCAKAGKSPIKCSLQSWPVTSAPWERMHIDYAGPIDGFFYLVAVDSFSKWPEIFKTKTTTTTKTIDMLEEIFTRHGYCKTLVSDNGPQFTSQEFHNFCATKGIEHVRTAPYHPQSNGQAEKFVDLLKTGIRKAKGNSDEKLREFLFSYRSTPSYALGMKSPAELAIGHKMNTMLDLLKPPAVNSPTRNEKMENQFNTHHGAKPKEFAVGASVYYQLHSGNASWQWTPAKVTKKIGQVNYEIKTNSGRLVKAHANQLKLRLQNDNTEKFTSDVDDSYIDDDAPQTVDIEDDLEASDVFEDAEEIPGEVPAPA